MPRPPRYATILTLYGIAGLVALTLATGLIAKAVAGSGLLGAAARLSTVAVLFVAWLYTWRKLALYMREKACNRLRG